MRLIEILLVIPLRKTLTHFPTAGVWKLEHHTTEFSLEQSGIELSNPI